MGARGFEFGKNQFCLAPVLQLSPLDRFQGNARGAEGPAHPGASQGSVKFIAVILGTPGTSRLLSSCSSHLITLAGHLCGAGSNSRAARARHAAEGKAERPSQSTKRQMAMALVGCCIMPGKSAAGCSASQASRLYSSYRVACYAAATGSMYAYAAKSAMVRLRKMAFSATGMSSLAYLSIVRHRQSRARIRRRAVLSLLRL